MGRRRAGRAVGAVVAVLLVGSGGYAAADAYDVVEPGYITLAPIPPTQAPFPTIRAAVEAPPLTTVLGPLDPDAPMPSAEVLTAAASDLTRDPRMGSSAGIVVADVLSGQVLVDIDGGTSRIPASTAKLLTSFAAITALGPDRTLSTRVVQPEPGRIVLVGGGDMMLGAGAGDPTAVNGRAGLLDLAAATGRELRAAGISEVSLGVDDGLFSGPSVHPGWRPGTGIYVAPVTALGVNLAKTREEPYPPRHADPSMHAAEVFAGLLAEQGITATPPARTTVDDAAPEIASVESAPMREIVRFTAQTSDNTIAEVLGRLVAVERGLPGSFQGATTAILAEVGAQGIDITGTVIADCSGLADGSVLRARLLVDLLLLAAQPGRVDLLPVVVDMPISGWQGTLFDRFTTGPAQGVVRAKTGSLPGVTSLAGTVQTGDGRLLVFAVMADATPPGGQPAPRAAIDEFVQVLAGCGCQLA
jgi:D-alanyl-D-alanine carboxypeptidase/D-alanyl-D-alanine-endopeptidase (penicillin-binding protein 4)